MRGSSLCSVRVPGRNNRKNEEALFKDTMAENFPKWGKDSNPHIKVGSFRNFP